MRFVAAASASRVSVFALSKERDIICVSTKEKKMRRDVRAVRSLRVVGRSESRRSNETGDAREREAGSERRARRVQVLLLPAVSLWNDRIQKMSLSLSLRPHESTRLVSATSLPLGQFYRYYRATFITGRFSSKIESNARKSKGVVVVVVERETTMMMMMMMMLCVF